MDPYDVRCAGIDDVPGICRVRDLVLSPGDLPASFVEEALMKLEFPVLVAVDMNGAVIGFAVCPCFVYWGKLVADSFRVVRLGNLLTFGVLPEYQGKGIGHDLFGAAVEAMADRGCEQVLVEVRLTNKRASAFYAKRGLKAQQVYPDYYTETSQFMEAEVNRIAEAEKNTAAEEWVVGEEAWKGAVPGARTRTGRRAAPWSLRRDDLTMVEYAAPIGDVMERTGPLRGPMYMQMTA